MAIDGDVAVIGANGADVDGQDDQGAAYVFVRSAGGWILQQQLVASDGQADDEFGTSVALAGDTAVVGAPRNSVTYSGQGSAHVFKLIETVWIEQACLTDTLGLTNDHLGWAVAVSDNRVLVGAFEDDIDGNPSQGSTVA